jgi:hypothetical protein
MAMIWFHALAIIAVIALALVFCIPERGEERFPFGRVTWEIRVGMGVCGHDNKRWALRRDVS